MTGGPVKLERALEALYFGGHQARSWMDSAACSANARFTDLDIAVQLETCATCPVRPPCLAYAISLKVTGVVYGGFLFPDRPIRKK